MNYLTVLESKKRKIENEENLTHNGGDLRLHGFSFEGIFQLEKQRLYGEQKLEVKGGNLRK